MGILMWWMSIRVLIMDDKINTMQTLASDRIVIRESGYLEVCADNQAQYMQKHIRQSF